MTHQEALNVLIEIKDGTIKGSAAWNAVRKLRPEDFPDIKFVMCHGIEACRESFLFFLKHDWTDPEYRPLFLQDGIDAFSQHLKGSTSEVR